MTLNTNLLSRLITWAATENTKRTDPEKAKALGLVKEDWVPPKSYSGKATPEGGWEQGSWAIAERNGVCQTAFCIAGSAVDASKDHLIVMDPAGLTPYGSRFYSGSVAVEKSSLPETLPEDVEVDEHFGILWLGRERWEYEDLDEAFYNVLYGKAPSIRDAGAEVLGLDEEQASVLFGGGNDAEDVVSIATAIAKSHGVDLDLPQWVKDEYLDEGIVEEYAYL